MHETKLQLLQKPTQVDYSDSGGGRLTPGRLSFVRLVLRTDGFLFGRLVLAVLPPLFQLEIDEFPHHPGLRQADSSQTSHPGGRQCKTNVCVCFVFFFKD